MSTPLPLGLAPYISPTTLVTAPTGIDWTTIVPFDDSTPAQQIGRDLESVRQGDVPRRRLREPGPPRHEGRGTAPRPRLPGDHRARRRAARPDPVLGEHPGAERPADHVPVARPRGHPGPGVPEQPVAPPVDARSRPGITSLRCRPSASTESVAPGGSAEGGQAVIVGGGYINKCYGRNGWAIQVTYLNGWPHCSLTSAVDAGVIVPAGERLHRVGDRELLRHLHRRHRGGRGFRAAGSRPRHRSVSGSGAGHPDPRLGDGLPACGGDDRDDDAADHPAGVHPVLHRRSAHPGCHDARPSTVSGAARSTPAGISSR